MFYPQAMTQIQLIIPARDVLAVTRELANRGVYHQVDGSHMNLIKEASSANAWQEKAAAYATLERRILDLMQALHVEEGLPPSTPPTSLIETNVVRPNVELIEQDVKRVSEQLVDEHKLLEQLGSILVQLEPIAGIALDFGILRHPHYLHAVLGIIPNANIARLQTSLARIPFVFLTLRRDDQSAVVWLAGSKRNAGILERAARSAYLNPLSLPETYQGTLPEIIKSLHADIELAQQRVSEQNQVIVLLREGRQQQLQLLLWQARANRVLAEAIGRFGRFHYTYVIVGWVPSSQVANFSRQLKQISKDILIETFPFKRGNLKQNVPVALHNPTVLRPFQQLVMNYARPRYEEVDPTWLMALTFPLLFGAMFGDVGHGLVLALIGWLASSRKVPALRSLANLGGLIAVCGLAAVVFGFLYGSLFGLENVLPTLWIRPMDNILKSLTAAIGVGVVLLSLGLLLGILNAWTARDWGRLLFDGRGAAGLVLYWSLVGLAVRAVSGGLPIPPFVLVVFAILSGSAVTFSEALKRMVEGHRPLVEGSLATYAVGAVFELFETLISLLSNSISYVRVGAFAIAHAGLSAVIFILAELASPARGVGYWIVIGVGNLFIVGFEGLIVGIQTMRLEYYEFFSKFFTGGGMRYEPLTWLSKAKE